MSTLFLDARFSVLPKLTNRFLYFAAEKFYRYPKCLELRIQGSTAVLIDCLINELEGEVHMSDMTAPG